LSRQQQKNKTAMISFCTRRAFTLFLLLAVSAPFTNASLRGSHETSETENGQDRPQQHDVENSDRRLKYGTKIVGGTNASPGEYPFFALWDEQCGASVIHDDLLLSAAHCNVPQLGNSVVVGAYNINNLSGATERRIVQKVNHPKWDDDPQTPAYDYVILKLNQPVTQKPIKLNRSSQNPSDNEDITVIGFGATSEGGSGSNILQEVKVQAYSHSTCVNQYGNKIKRAVHLCAGVNGGGKDSCQGDSGGPIFDFDNGEPLQVGVVSFGEGCARPNRAGVYARVSGVVDWIEEQICALTEVNRPSNCGPTSAPVPTAAPVPGSAPTGGGGTPTGGGPTPTGGFPTPTGGGFPTPTGGGFPTPTGGGFPTPTGGGFPTPTSPTWWGRRTKKDGGEEMIEEERESQ